MSVCAAFPLRLTTASPSHQDALQDDFGEAVVARDMPEPCLFPFLDSFQKRFRWKLILLRTQSFGVVLQVGNAETFPLSA